MNICKFERKGHIKKTIIQFKTFLMIFSIFFFTIGCVEKNHNSDLIGKLFNQLSESFDSPLKVDILNELAYRESWNGGKIPQDYINKAENLAKKINYWKGVVDAQCILGHIYFLNGDFIKSKYVYRKALSLAEKIEYNTGKAMAYNGIARYLQVMGKFARALDIFLASEEICKNSSDKKDKRTLAAVNYGLGALCYYDPEDFKEARKYFQKSLDLGKEIKDNIVKTSGLYTIGVQHQSLGEYHDAEINLTNCLNLSKEIGLIYNQANAYEGLGDMYLDTMAPFCFFLILPLPGFGDIYSEIKNNKALKNYEESYSLFKKIGNLFQISEIEKRLGKLYNRKGEYEKAIGYLNKALKFARDAGIPKTITGACEEMVIAKEALEDYKSASYYYKILLENKEFLRKNEMLKQKLILDFQQAAKKESIKRTYLLIALCSAIIIIIIILFFSLKLRKQKAKIEDQARQLEKALIIEKEVSIHKDELMNTVYHQYKTPLANIDSCVQVLKEYSAKLSGKDIENHYNKISSNLGRMTRLMDQLSMFGKKFNPDNYVDLEKTCRAVVEEIQANEGDKHIIEFDSSGYCGKVKMDKDILEIMLQNLINNSIKFSPQETKIKVELLCDASYVFIKVSDNGMGIPEDYLKWPYERFHRGSNVGAIPGTGLGLSIVKRYTDMYNGKISINSKVNTGTTITIKIPRNVNEAKGDHNG